jgi:hypothetical protein
METARALIKYVREVNANGDYMAMFLMGKSVGVLINELSAHKGGLLHDMQEWRNTNLNIRLLKNHSDTFLLHQLQFDDSNAHAFDLGSFFNRQQVGLRILDWKRDESLSKFLVPIATFAGSGSLQKH